MSSRTKTLKISVASLLALALVACSSDSSKSRKPKQEWKMINTISEMKGWDKKSKDRHKSYQHISEDFPSKKKSPSKK